jgi:hypothetical protein
LAGKLLLGDALGGGGSDIPCADNRDLIDHFLEGERCGWCAGKLIRSTGERSLSRSRKRGPVTLERRWIPDLRSLALACPE